MEIILMEEINHILPLNNFFNFNKIAKSKMKVLLKLLLIAAPIFLLNACYYDKEQELYPNSFVAAVDQTNVLYSKNVLPVFSANCAGSGCHVGGPTSFNFGTWTEVNTYLNIATNNLLCSVDWSCNGGSYKMPKGGTQISAIQITTIKNWIAQGHKNN